MANAKFTGTPLEFLQAGHGYKYMQIDATTRRECIRWQCAKLPKLFELKGVKMSYIERDYAGLRSECSVLQSDYEKTTFRHAMHLFGHMVKNNTRISLAAWADIIEGTYCSDQATECIRVIRRAL